MRISTNQLFDQNIRAILENQTALARTQESLSTGKKVNRPSDDPVGASQVIRLTEELDKLGQYKRNNDLVMGSLEQQEAVLFNINSSAQRARVLVQQAGSGIMSVPDRRAIAGELEQIRNEILDLMNSSDAQGNFFFSGSQSRLPPFSLTPAVGGEQILYAGDTTDNQVALSDSVRVQSTTNGFELFEDVPARRTFTLGGGTASVTEAKIAQQSGFDQFYADNYDRANPANNQFSLDVLVGNQVRLRNVGTGATLDVFSYTPGTPISFGGLSFTLDATPGQSRTFSLDPPEKKSIVQTITDAMNVFSNPTSSSNDVQNAIDTALVNLDNGMERLALERSGIGGRLNVAESVKNTILDLEISVKQSRSSIQDIDFAEASIAFAQQETALNAILATFPRVTGLSLFDFI